MMRITFSRSVKLDPISPQKGRILAQNRQFQAKMMKHESPIISESIKSSDLKI